MIARHPRDTQTNVEFLFTGKYERIFKTTMVLENPAHLTYLTNKQVKTV